MAGNVTVQAGPWSGAILYQLPVNDPQILAYGPANFTLPNGSTAPNPLSTRSRYVFSNRGEGQFQAPAITTVGLKVGKVLRLDRYQFEVSGIFRRTIVASGFRLRDNIVDRSGETRRSSL